MMRAVDAAETSPAMHAWQVHAQGCGCGRGGG
jgi:hypothetical protein